MKNNAKVILETASKASEKLLQKARVESDKVLEKARVESEKLNASSASSASSVNFKLLAQDIGYIKQDIADIKKSLEEKYVTQAQFQPIQRIVYGVVSIFGIAIIAAIFKLIFK